MSDCEVANKKGREVSGDSKRLTKIAGVGLAITEAHSNNTGRAKSPVVSPGSCTLSFREVLDKADD